MPKLLCSDVAHRSRLGFPSRSCPDTPRSANHCDHVATMDAVEQRAGLDFLPGAAR